MSGRHKHAGRIVFDPALPPRELRALRAADRARAAFTVPLRHVRHPADRILAAYLLAATGAAAAELAAPGVPWAWAWFLAVTAALAAVTAAAARCAALRYRGRCVNPARMDPASRQVLARAQAAIGDVLGARIRREGHLDVLGTAAVLNAREWEVARMLGRACGLAAAQARILDGAPATPAARSQQEILRQARAAAIRRADDIEDYARQVRAADAAYRAHAAAGPLASIDGSFLDLLAATAADSRASEEVRRMQAEAATAGQAFRAS